MPEQLTKQCLGCSGKFSITAAEQDFIAGVAPNYGGTACTIPLPELCSRCREQQRICFRNELKLYRRRCSMSGKSLVSIFSEDKPYPVLAPEIWWSDRFDPLAYGREIDFTRPFFQQFADLLYAVPKPAIFNASSENSTYTNYSAGNKNCYLLVGSSGCEDSLYCSRAFESRDVIDSFDLYKCELCYECLCSSGLYSCALCRECHNSSDLFHCSNCQGCSHCFGCVNLVNKQYQIYNRPCSKDRYAAEIERLKSNPAQAENWFETLRRDQPQPGERLINCEDCSGDLLLNCKQCSGVFTLKNSRDCMYCAWGEKNSDCFDCNFFDYSERQYNCSNLQYNYEVLFSFLVWSSQRVIHSVMCYNSQDLFGCTGTKKERFCILNKQYPEAEYHTLAAKLVRHMRETGEWGRFFPPAISLFGYNETVAADFYPLSEEQARQQGFRWHSTGTEKSAASGPEIPLSPVSTDDLINTIWSCIGCGGPHRIQPQEAALHQKIGVSAPPYCFNCRHRARVQRVNRRQFFERKCCSCSTIFNTVQDPAETPLVYCRNCSRNELS